MAKQNLKSIHKKIAGKIKEDKKQIELIAEECNKYGLNIYEVFRHAGIPQPTVTNWRKKEPDAFDTLAKIYKAIDELKKLK